MWIMLEVIIVAILGILAYVATKPDSFKIVRSLEIKAAPETIAPHLSNFHDWQAWSPWEGIDADLVRSYDGPSSGKGAVYGWKGQKTGEGRMEILDASPEHIDIQLDFIKPFKANNLAVFKLKPQADKTLVVWSMSGKNAYLNKLFSLFMDMDAMIGKDFEKGLNQLKTLVETA